jgi:hypothetical protein
MAGRLEREGTDVCFVPRFPFVEGTTYVVVVDGGQRARLVRTRIDRPATTEVLEIRPTAAEVPRNLLRLYVLFSAPMSEGFAATQVRLVDADGQTMDAALLPSEHELWDGEHRRITILLDPARIKRGLVGNRRSGYPLRTGASIRLAIGAEFRDARGNPLRAPAERLYTVGADERQHVEPARWTLTGPIAGTREALEMRFDRPLDHGLLARCLYVVDATGQVIRGIPRIGPEERAWQLVPTEPWAPIVHRLVIDPVLEDLAGNSVSRVFDRDLSRPEDAPREARPVTVTFRPR